MPEGRSTYYAIQHKWSNIFAHHERREGYEEREKKTGRNMAQQSQSDSRTCLSEVFLLLLRALRELRGYGVSKQ